mmetsp:Transcript_8601/g.21613  ORF Transcript_8601/g.21613 Transcript_8601/m.21613 type:complete len:204 (+) Transcript_8601:115-726(+)
MRHGSGRPLVLSQGDKAHMITTKHAANMKTSRSCDGRWTMVNVHKTVPIQRTTANMHGCQTHTGTPHTSNLLSRRSARKTLSRSCRRRSVLQDPIDGSKVSWQEIALCSAGFWEALLSTARIWSRSLMSCWLVIRIAMPSPKREADHKSADVMAPPCIFGAASVASMLPPPAQEGGRSEEVSKLNPSKALLYSNTSLVICVEL